mmetsp:Transcript_15996/g.35295  ORF Transcript_15996/g.35295 Transcript_15996/m.35295 type:complete len:101 (-) Transcript_15996:864-1166(-)
MDPTLPTAGDGTSSGVDDEATPSGAAARRRRVRAAVPATAAGVDGPDAVPDAAADETTGTGDAPVRATGSTSLNPVPGGGGREGISFSDPATLVPPNTLL